jgi:hypothetical protein
LSTRAREEDVAVEVGVDAHRVHWPCEVELQHDEPLRLVHFGALEDEPGELLGEGELAVGEEGAHRVGELVVARGDRYAERERPGRERRHILEDGQRRRRLFRAARERHRRGDDEGDVLLEAIGDDRRPRLDREHRDPRAPLGVADRELERVRHSGVRLAEERLHVVREALELPFHFDGHGVEDASDDVRYLEAAILGRHLHVHRLELHPVVAVHHGLGEDLEIDG